MKFKYLLSLSIIILYSCSSNESKQESHSPFVGTWKEVSKEFIKGDPEIDKKYREQFNNKDEYLLENKYETFLLIKWEGEDIEVKFDITDQPELDKCDNIKLEDGILTFRHKPGSGIENTYTVKAPSGSTMKGELHSWNGNTYRVTYEKMPANTRIEHKPPSN